MDLRPIALSSVILNVLLYLPLSILPAPPSKPSCPFYMNLDASMPRPSSLVAQAKDSKQRLTDVVIPFHAAHLERVRRNLAQWIEYAPCRPLSVSPDVASHQVSRDQHEFYSSHPSLGHNITLTFALSSVMDVEVRHKIRQMVAALPKRIKVCFGKVRISFAGLEGGEDGYLRGTRYMFESMLNGTIGLKDPHYVLYMEPDMLPVRRYWLSALDAMTRHPTIPFWVKGSLYRGGHRRVFTSLCNALHINGNAIYNLGDPAFRDFYYHEVLASADCREAYDVYMARFLVDPHNFNRTREILHKFQYTEAIQNQWRWKYSLSELKRRSPNLYLVHGGIPTR